MGTYAVTSFTTRGSAEVVSAALKVKIDTIDTGKTLRLINIAKEGNEFVGSLIYDT